MSQTYDIVVAPSTHEDLEDQYWGRTNYEKMRLVVDEALHPEHLRQTILHECIHVILRHTGHNQERNDEDVIEAIAYGLVDAIRNNDWLLALFKNHESPPPREELATLCHDQWSGWMTYLFDKGTFNEDGSFTIHAKLVDRWIRQMKTPYSELSSVEQNSDRLEANKFINLLKEMGIL